jgi:uncharacterized protein YidB (DUF937 family)
LEARHAESAFDNPELKMGLLDIVTGMLAGQQGQTGMAGMAGSGGSSGHPDLMSAVIAMLGNDAPGGGLLGMMQKFQAHGMGDQMNSWISSGQNLPVSPDQLTRVLGNDQMSQLAEKFGLSTGDLGAQLSQMLPHAVDNLTPDGQVPAGGLGNLGDLLGSLMRR